MASWYGDAPAAGKGAEFAAGGKGGKAFGAGAGTWVFIPSGKGAPWDYGYDAGTAAAAKGGCGGYDGAYGDAYAAGYGAFAGKGKTGRPVAAAHAALAATNGWPAAPPKGISEAKKQKKAEKKKQEKDNPVEVLPLDSIKLEEIRQYLTDHNGAMDLGRLTTAFPGLKKAQVVDAFTIERVGDEPSSREIVSIYAAGSSEVYAALAAPVEREPKIKKKKKDNTPLGEVAPLAPWQVEDLRHRIEANGGSIDLGMLTTQVPGLKKIQLEGHFSFEYIDGNMDRTLVIVDGYIPNDGFEAKFAAHHFAMVNWKTRQPPAYAESGPPKKKQKADPSLPPLPLDNTKVEEIRRHLEANGGTMDMGRLTTVYPGLKKAQVEAHFLVTPGDSSDGRQGRLVVSL